jgi:hypothetical protein
MNTEQQARELWCPMVRASNGTQATNCTVNVALPIRCEEPGEPKPYPIQGNNCVASGCAMWRWASMAKRRRHRCADPFATEEPARPRAVPASWTFCPSEDDNACWLESEAEAATRCTGYCGLAGMQQVLA